MKSLPYFGGVRKTYLGRHNKKWSLRNILFTVFAILELGPPLQLGIGMWQKGEGTVVKCIITRLANIFLCPQLWMILMTVKTGVWDFHITTRGGAFAKQKPQFSLSINEKYTSILSNYVLSRFSCYSSFFILMKASQASPPTMWTLLVT